jgi:hypothetical protein
MAKQTKAIDGAELTPDLLAVWRSDHARAGKR